MSDMSWLHNTTADEQAQEHLKYARTYLEQMESLIPEIKQAMDERTHGAFPIHWCTMLNEKFMAFHNEVCRANGAVLVRGKRPTRSGPSQRKEADMLYTILRTGEEGYPELQFIHADTLREVGGIIWWYKRVLRDRQFCFIPPLEKQLEHDTDGLWIQDLPKM